MTRETIGMPASRTARNDIPYLFKNQGRLVITTESYRFSCCPILKPIVWVAGRDCDIRGELHIWKCSGCEELFSIQHSPACTQGLCRCLLDKTKYKVVESKYMR